MKNKVLLLTIIILILGGIFYLNYKEDTKNKVENLSERLFNIKIDTLSVVNHQFAFTDQLIANEHIYLKDYSNQQIIEINYAGDLLKTYGKYGSGPKENQLIRGFFIDKTSYYTSDSEKNVLSKINMNSGDLEYYYKLKEPASISGFLSSGKVIVKSEKIFDKSFPVLNFKLVDPLKEESFRIDVSEFYNVDQPHSSWIYDGSFVPTKDGGVVYVPFYNHKILKFDNNGNLVYSKNLIYQVPEIKLKTIGDMTVPEENDRPHYYSGSANSKKLYLLSSVLLSSKEKGIPIDIYDYKSGDYVNSISINRNSDGNFPNAILVDDHNRLILFYEQSFTILKMSQ